MNTFTALLRHFFYPNPAGGSYGSTSMIVAMAICALLIVISFVIRWWRTRQADQRVRTLSRGWSSVTFWFGVVGLVLVVSRAEHIQFFAMRFLWVLWGVALAVYIGLQIRLWRARYYQVLPKLHVEDPRDKYIPGKKK
jgi:glucan phosphoethanolaminetransferase (alkaline phosphatase superfamily)